MLIFSPKFNHINIVSVKVSQQASSFKCAVEKRINLTEYLHSAEDYRFSEI